MSPEQVTGDPAAIDHRADVYALGVILFELLAHRLPYQLENRPLAEAARLIRSTTRRGSARSDPELRGDVETIVAKALEKDPARRYAVGGGPGGGPAAPAGATSRSWRGRRRRCTTCGKFARRHKALVGGVLATVAALVLGLVGTILFAVGEARQRGQAERTPSRRSTRSARRSSRRTAPAWPPRSRP